MSYDFVHYDWKTRREHMYDTADIRRSNQRVEEGNRAAREAARALPDPPNPREFKGKGGFKRDEYEDALVAWYARVNSLGTYEVELADPDPDPTIPTRDDVAAGDGTERKRATTRVRKAQTGEVEEMVVDASTSAAAAAEVKRQRAVARQQREEAYVAALAQRVQTGRASASEVKAYHEATGWTPTGRPLPSVGPYRLSATVSNDTRWMRGDDDDEDDEEDW